MKEFSIVEISSENRTEPNESELKYMTAEDLLESGLFGLWKNRKDIGDSREFARTLRERAQKRIQV